MKRQRDVVKRLRKEFGHYAVTVFTASEKNKCGILDVEIAHEGLSVWVEVKLNKDPVSDMQKKFLARHRHSSCVIRFVGDEFEIQTSLCEDGCCWSSGIYSADNSLKKIITRHVRLSRRVDK